MKRRFSLILGFLVGILAFFWLGSQPSMPNTFRPGFNQPGFNQPRTARPVPSSDSVVARSGLWYYPPGTPVNGCTQIPRLNLQVTFSPGELTLGRFRGPLQAALWNRSAPNWLRTYTPPEEIALAHPSNFGERFLQDVAGRSTDREPVLVLHETVSSGWQAVKFFQTPNAQASYHALVKQDGTIFYLVPPDKRAFGAGDSIFNGPRGQETVQTFREYPASVNNFAYHVSLESPPDGRGNGNTHSGYTDRQYVSLAWLVAKTGVPESRFTTHKAVDQSGSRRDPRSFDWAKFQSYYRLFPKTDEISIGCR